MLDTWPSHLPRLFTPTFGATVARSRARRPRGKPWPMPRPRGPGPLERPQTRVSHWGEKAADGARVVESASAVRDEEFGSWTWNSRSYGRRRPLRSPAPRWRRPGARFMVLSFRGRLG